MDASVFDRTYDVLLSYRRTDSRFVEALATRLNGLDVRCFVDSKVHENGRKWKKFWAEALKRKPNAGLDPISGPGVVVIATDSMLEEKKVDHVVREIREGFDSSIDGEHEIPITVLCFGRAGAEELQLRLGPDHDLGERHHPHPFDGVAVDDPDSIPEEIWGYICRAAARVSRGTTTRRLRALRDEARRWAKSVLRTIWSDEDFSRNTESANRIRTALRQSISSREMSRLAVVGPGGFGKTVQLARTLDHILDDDPDLFFPVIVDPHELQNGALQLRKKLGLGPDPTIEPLSLVEGAYAWAQGRVFFITDSLERSDHLETCATELRALNTSAALWITSRPGAWEAVKDILSFGAEEIVRTSEINSETAASVLGVKYGKFVRNRPYLQQPVFLDIATHLLRSDDLSEGKKALVVENETALLDTLSRWAVDHDEGIVGAQHEIDTRKELLRAIATTQIEQGRFDIAQDELLDVDPSLAKERSEALEYLCATRPLLIKLVGADGQKRVRLRHDIVDSHNISKVLLDEPALRKKMLDTFERSFNQVVYEGVAQTAHDRGLPEIIDEFFAFFLLAIDNKHDKNHQPMAWNTGYVVTAKIPVFLERLKKVLCGEFLGDQLPNSPGEAVSSLDPPRLTQAALSSVASMFLGAKPVSILDPDGKLLSALDKHARRARYRGRLMEAVAKLDDGQDGAIDLLEKFGRNREALRSDQPLAIYIANGLADIARSKPALCKRTINTITEMVELLEGEPDEVDLPILRVLHRRRNEAREIDNQRPLPEHVESEREFLQGLRLHEWRNFSRFSDWTVFEYYCRCVRANRGVFNGKVSQQVIQALGRGFWHDHVRCHADAAFALGAIDHPLSRGVLLHVLAFEANDRTATAVIAALEEQVLRVRDRENESTAFLRALKRAAAERYRRLDAFNRRTRLVLKLQSAFDRSDVAIVTEGCMEIVSLIPTVELSPAPAGQFVETQWPWLTDEETSADVGPELEEKLAILGASMQTEPAVELQYGSATWAIPARAHRAIAARMAPVERKTREKILSEDGKEGLTRYDASIERHVEAAAHLYAAWEAGFGVAFSQPAIAVVHVVITAPEGQLLKARRSLSALYHPGAWAGTFEEQVQLGDLAVSPMLDSIVRRGIREEFEVELKPADLDVVSASLSMEWPLMNPAILVHVHSHRSGDEFLSTDLKTKMDPEIIDRTLVPLVEVKSKIRRSPVGFHYLESVDQEHPSSVARMLLALGR